MTKSLDLAHSTDFPGFVSVKLLSLSVAFKLFFFFKLHTPELNLSMITLNYSTRALNVFFPMHFCTSLWTRSLTLSLPIFVEFAFSFPFFFFNGHLFSLKSSFWMSLNFIFSLCYCAFHSLDGLLICSLSLNFISFQPPVHGE